MNIRYEEILHEGVKEDGTFINEAGAVETKGWVRMSLGEGCSLKKCGCKCSEGYWLFIMLLEKLIKKAITAL